MGANNTRGLELSWKPFKGKNGAGRWYKTIKGKEHYFGTAKGVSDRAGYKAAVEAYRAHNGQAEAEAKASTESNEAWAALADIWAASHRSPDQFQEAIQTGIDAISKRSPAVAEFLALKQETIEKANILNGLASSPVARLRTIDGKADQSDTETNNTLLDLFLKDQAARLAAWHHYRKLRSAGQDVHPPKGEVVSPGRLISIRRDAADWRDMFGNKPWVRTEAAATELMKTWRKHFNDQWHNGECKTGTVCEKIKFGRHFLGWCETNFKLDRLPRDKALFRKPDQQPSAVSIPMPDLFKIWDNATELERCWIMASLNCAFYAKDKSDLTAGQVDLKAGRINHNRLKTKDHENREGVNVIYQLWPETLKRIKPFVDGKKPADHVWLTEDGTILVDFKPQKKDPNEEVRVDNVRNHFVRLCNKVEGLHEMKPNKKGILTARPKYSWSNMRDTASTAMEGINKALTDTFLAHRDKRMAAMYVDGKMVDSSQLDIAIAKLEPIFKPIWDVQARKEWIKNQPAEA